jgi:hypothetical protein
MTRIRSIKPEFFRHEGLQDLERANPGRYPMLTFEGLWGICDRAGRFEWRPRQIHLDVLPFLDFDMEQTLGLLSEGGFIRSYEAGGKRYGLVIHFLRHQTAESLKNEKVRCPEPPIPGQVMDDSMTDPRAVQDATRKDPGPVRDASRKEAEREREAEKERETEREAEADTPMPAAAAPSVPLDWLEEELQALGIHNAQCRSLSATLGLSGLRAALFKIRSKGHNNPAGLLIKRGPELAQEGQALLEQQLERARALAPPQAMEDPAWRAFPPGIQEDLEVQTAWCAWKAAAAKAKGSGENGWPEAHKTEMQVQACLLDLLKARHPDRREILARLPPTNKFLSAQAALAAAFLHPSNSGGTR